MLLNMSGSKCNIRFRVNFQGFAVKSSLKIGETRSVIIDTGKENLRPENVHVLCGALWDY